MEHMDEMGAITRKDVYAADRNDAAQQQVASVTYLALLVAYGVGLATFLGTNETRGLGPWVTGVLSFISLTLLGFYGQLALVQALREASLAVQEAQAVNSSQDVGAALIERWNDLAGHGTAKGMRLHLVALRSSYLMATVVGVGICLLPIWKLWTDGFMVHACAIGIVTGVVLVLYGLGWKQARKEVIRFHKLANKSPAFASASAEAIEENPIEVSVMIKELPKGLHVWWLK